MTQVAWSARALTKLRQIERYNGQYSRAYASSLIRDLLRSVKRLELFPRSGRLVPELDRSGIREIVFRRYRILYLYDADADRVEVVTLLHPGQQFGP